MIRLRGVVRRFVVEQLEDQPLRVGARHAATTLTDYRPHPEDLPAPIGLMLCENPPIDDTANEQHDGITLVSWGPGRGGL